MREVLRTEIKAALALPQIHVELLEQRAALPFLKVVKLRAVRLRLTNLTRALGRSQRSFGRSSRVADAVALSARTGFHRGFFCCLYAGILPTRQNAIRIISVSIDHVTRTIDTDHISTQDSTDAAALASIAQILAIHIGLDGIAEGRSKDLN